METGNWKLEAGSMEEGNVESISSYVREPQDLEVFKRAYAVSLDIHRTSLKFPQVEQYDLAKQMRRASKSVCANLAEGFYKQVHSTPEFRRFVSMSIGSCGEMKIWIKYCLDLGYIDKNKHNKWVEEYNIVSRMLQNLRSKIKDRK